MPEENGTRLNRAARDVVQERQRQITGEGYSLTRDDGYVKGEMADAAATYATLAGQPRSLSTMWPWGQATFKPSADRRRDLVKAGALILAEIERLDRQQLIQPAIVRRDEDGMFWHPDMPDFDEGEEEKCKAWVAEQGLEVKTVSLEFTAEQAVVDRYFDSGDSDCSYWEPARPPMEDGWFCLQIGDTDDGPVCWWARRVVTP